MTVGMGGGCGGGGNSCVFIATAAVSALMSVSEMDRCLPEQMSPNFFSSLTPTLASISGPFWIWPCSCYHMDTSTVRSLLLKCTEAQARNKATKLVRVLACVVISLEVGIHSLLLPVFSYGRSTLSAIPLDSGSLYCLTSFSPSSLSLGPWQLLSQCFAPRDSGRGGWVGKREREREREMEWGKEWKQENRQRLIFRATGHPMAVVGEVPGWNLAEQQTQTAEGNGDLTTL